MHRDRQNLRTNVIMAACMEALLTSVISVIHLCFCLALSHWHWHQDESGVLRLGVHTIQYVTRQGSDLFASDAGLQNLYKHGKLNYAGPSPNKRHLPNLRFSALLYGNPLGSRRCPALPRAFDNVTYHCHRTMRAFNFSLIVGLSYIAMFGATPIGSAGAIAPPQTYVAC